MRTARGFTLIEALIAMGIILIGASVAIIQIRSAMVTIDADKAIDTVAGQLRYARQVAVDQRRNVFFEFIGDNQVKATRLGDDSEVILDTTLPGGFSFAIPEGAEDTPDGYGFETPVYFNMGTNGTFQADGTFVDDAGLVVNGSVFTLGPNPGTARALTVTGSTGRTRIYWRSGEAWTERK